MLYLEIKKCKEEINTVVFKQEIVNMEACMKIITNDTEGCGKILSNYTFFSDIWFSGVETVKEFITEGVDYCGYVNMSHNGFLLAML